MGHFAVINVTCAISCDLLFFLKRVGLQDGIPALTTLGGSCYFPPVSEQ